VVSISIAPMAWPLAARVQLRPSIAALECRAPTHTRYDVAPLWFASADLVGRSTTSARLGRNTLVNAYFSFEPMVKASLQLL
jgi:hypothetical protein